MNDLSKASHGDECPLCQNGTVEVVDNEVRCMGECGAVANAKNTAADNSDNSGSLVRKVTEGTWIQTFDKDRKCVKQEFIAANESEYEDANGVPMSSWAQYHPFDTVQPGLADILLAEIKESLEYADEKNRSGEWNAQFVIAWAKQRITDIFVRERK